MAENYERILEKIAKASGISRGEIENKIKAKREKLSGLISKEGAAQVVASELGVSFESEKLKIDELLPGMRRVNVIGKVIKLFPVRTFTTKKGEQSKVVNFWIADDTSNAKVVLWDTNHISLIEKGEIAEGKVVEIRNASMRDNEIHLGNFSEIKLSQENFDNVVTEKVFKGKMINDFRKGENVSTRAFIVQAFEPRFFYVCPQCSKKVYTEGESSMCREHDKVVPEKRAVTNIVIDDGTDSIRAVLFHEPLIKLGLTEFDNPEKLSEQKQAALGREMIFSGNVRNNAFFNTPEFVIDDITEADIDKAIEELEN